MPENLPAPECHRRDAPCPQERRLRELEHENKAHHSQFDRVLAEIRAGNAQQQRDAVEFRAAIAQQKRELEDTRHRLWGNGQPGEMQKMGAALESFAKQTTDAVAGLKDSLNKTNTKLVAIAAGGGLGTGVVGLKVVEWILSNAT